MSNHPQHHIIDVYPKFEEHATTITTTITTTSSSSHLPAAYPVETEDEQPGPSGGPAMVDINRHYDGAKHWRGLKRYQNPTPQDVGRMNPIPLVPVRRHRDNLHRVTNKPEDLLRYISPTQGKPLRLMVQATPEACQTAQGEWR